MPPGQEPKDDSHVEAVADAARKLVQERDNWLNPPDAAPSELRTRTLTNLYNERPAWLADAHARLDAAVLAAYAMATGEAWNADLTPDELLSRLLTLNMRHAGAAHQG